MISKKCIKLRRYSDALYSSILRGIGEGIPELSRVVGGGFPADNYSGANKALSP